MPRANQYLLLYVLDLLSVFARKSDKNLMTPASTSPPPLFLFPPLTLPQISPSSFALVSSLTPITSFLPANISSAKRFSSFSSTNRTASSSTYHHHHVQALPPHGVHHPVPPPILYMTETIPILFSPAPMTNTHPPMGGSSLEKTTDASPAGAQHTNLLVGCPHLRHRALPFHVAKHRLFPLHRNPDTLHPFLIGSAHLLQIPLTAQHHHRVRLSSLLSPNGLHPIQPVQHLPPLTAVEPSHPNAVAPTMTGTARGC